MKIYDISVPIKLGMPVWPGDPQVELTPLSSIADGDPANLTQVCMSVHTGTHIDAPKHFIDNGKTIDQIPLEKLCGLTFVIQMGDEVDVIDEKILKSHPNFQLLKKTSKVLFRTRNSSYWSTYPTEFQLNYVGIDKSGARFLEDLGLDLVGIDYLSVASFQDTKSPHEILLSSEVVLLEGLNLSKVKGGVYNLFCLPLNISNCDGSPARAILVEY